MPSQEATSDQGVPLGQRRVSRLLRWPAQEIFSQLLKLQAWGASARLLYLPMYRMAYPAGCLYARQRALLGMLSVSLVMLRWI